MNPGKVLANPNARQMGIGQFYVELTAHLFGGRVLPHGNDHVADIDHEPWNAFFEVKGASNTHGVRIFSIQLEDYLEGLGRQREYCLYFAWRYANHNNNPEGNIGKHARTVGELYQALAKRTRELYVIDARLLDALRRRKKLDNHRRDGEETPTLTLWAWVLKGLMNDHALIARMAGFRPRHFRVIEDRLTTLFEGNLVQCSASFLVPRELEPKVLRRLSKLRQMTFDFE